MEQDNNLFPIIKAIVAMLSMAAIMLVTDACSTVKDSSERTAFGSQKSVMSLSQDSTLATMCAWKGIDASEISSWGSITTITLYDTDADIDSITGKRPVKAEIVRRDSLLMQRWSTERDSVQSSVTVNKSDSIIVNEADSSMTISVKHFERTDNTANVATRMTWLMFAIGVFAAAIIVYKNFK